MLLASVFFELSNFSGRSLWCRDGVLLHFSDDIADLDVLFSGGTGSRQHW